MSDHKVKQTVSFDEAKNLSGEELSSDIVMVGATAGEEFTRRRVVVSIENDVIGDGMFAPEVAKTLRVLADLIDLDQAGRHACEVYRSPDGTLAVIRAEDINGECIPYRASGMLLQASFAPREKV